MIHENRVIGSRTKSGDPQIRALTDVLSIIIGFVLHEVMGTNSLPNTDFFFGVLNILGDSIDEFLQGMRSAHLQEPAPVPVGIDVDSIALKKFFGMGLGPFG